MTANLDTIPRVSVEVDGAPLEPAHARALAAVRVQQRLSQPTQCELSFFDPEGALAEVETLVPGSTLTVRVAAASDHVLFQGDLTAIELLYEPAAGRVVRVRGYDRLHRLRKRQPVRTHTDVDAEQLARRLLGALGVEEIDAPESGPRWEHVIQHGQTDLELLQELAGRAGLYFHLADRRLSLVTLAGSGTEPTITLELGRSLLEARVELNADRACRTVVAHGWSPTGGATDTREAARPRSGRDVRARVDATAVGGEPRRVLADLVGDGAAQSEAAAQAELDRRAATEILLEGVALGDPRLRPGMAVQVQGLARAISGRHVLSEVTHVIDTRVGYVTEISTEPPAPSRRRREGSATLGVVSRVDDPLRAGRVRLRLPTFEDVETDWIQVVSPGAGPDKGLVMVPDVGDQVLYLPMHGDPSHGVVVGGLYGRRGPPDPGVELGRVRRFELRTPGGHRIVLDDHGHTLRVEDETGSYLEMNRTGVKLHAERELVIEAPGREVRIRGRDIRFERA